MSEKNQGHSYKFLQIQGKISGQWLVADEQWL